MLKRLLFGKPKRYFPIQIDITNACNLRCKHCYHAHHNNKGALALEEWKDVLNQYRVLVKMLNYRPMVHICGGEPTLSPHFTPIIQFLKSWGDDEPSIEILSNGTMTQRLDWDLLKSLKSVTVQVSLDGPSAIHHDKIRGKGSFERAIFGIKRLQSHGIRVVTLATLSKRTSQNLEEFFILGRSLGLDGVGFTRLIVEGHAKELVSSQEDRPLTALELKSAYEKILLLSAKHEVKTRYGAPLFHLIHRRVGMNGRFQEGIVINYQGYYLASSRVDLKLGHALRDGIEKIYFKNEILNKLRNRKVAVCGSCSDFAICGGDRNAAFAAYGDFLAPDPGCWKSQSIEMKSVC